MKIIIKAKPGAKREYVIRESARFVVAIKERAVDGKANAAVVAALAKHLKIPRSRVRIVKGAASRDKIVAIDE